MEKNEKQKLVAGEKSGREDRGDDIEVEEGVMWYFLRGGPFLKKGTSPTGKRKIIGIAGPIEMIIPIIGQES